MNQPMCPLKFIMDIYEKTKQNWRRTDMRDEPANLTIPDSIRPNPAQSEN